MDRVFTRVAGLDVHKDVVVACVRTPLPDGNQAVQTASFGATTEDLLGLRDWLVGERVEVVGMESTGVYWKPVFYLLEDDVECWLLNARHLRNVPGRKTSRTRCGSRSWSSTGWCGPASCRPSRSGSCAT